ncbi:MAG: DNA repair protein RecO [Candidatus Marinimicrobia bacterium]|nr:DNA repair protein RecO [Candidatus Neomarinimicrobiota bacterium]MDP6852881.1 DNA repair protein RecO [Candidatus Neomarinimicrobiota bacterium]MDP6936462.1 DNA repair protein RecO [Candidatus Neomarinimicrobiota bacterium]
MLIATNALVLKTIPYGDTSVISRLFTEREGKVSILAKGAWRKKSTTGSVLEPMNHIHLQYYHKYSREIQILKDCGFSAKYTHIRNNLHRTLFGFSIVEMLDKSTLDNNPFPILYRLGWRVLEKLNDEKNDVYSIFAFFLYQLSLRLGFMPEINQCRKCKSQLSTCIFDEQLGELVCLACSHQGKLQMDEKNMAFLRQLENLHLDDLETIRADRHSVLHAIQFLEKFTQFHIESLRRMKALPLANKLLLSEGMQ